MALSSVSVSILVTHFLLFIHSSVIQASQIGAELCPVQVREHFLTQRPGVGHVSAESQCTTFEQGELSFLQCDGELNGNYQWQQENKHTNYVLFNLSPITFLTKINFTYTVASGTQKPKISFCSLPANMSIDSTFSNLECQEVQVEATGGTVVGTLVPSFGNSTGKIGMEVITQSIKAAFTATRVEFFGTCTVSSTGATTFPPETSSSKSSPVSRTADGQANTQPANDNILSVSGDSVLNGKKTIKNTLLITLMCFILSRKVF